MSQAQSTSPVPPDELESIARLAAAAFAVDGRGLEGNRLAALIDYANVIRFLHHQAGGCTDGLVTVLVGHFLELSKDRPGGRDAAITELARFIDDPALDPEALTEHGASWLDAGGGTLLDPSDHDRGQARAPKEHDTP